MALSRVGSTYSVKRLPSLGPGTPIWDSLQSEKGAWLQTIITLRRRSERGAQHMCLLRCSVLAITFSDTKT